MTDAVFSPALRPDNSPAPGGAQLVYLRETLFVMKGMYHHPIADADKPLPPHRWALVNEEKSLFSEGNTSDDKGISAIFRPDTTSVGDDAEWQLWLIPIFKDGDSSEVAFSGEVWIDVDKNEWVRPSELTAMDRVEPRRLLRIVRWTSPQKAASGGGFKEPCPSSPDFATTGLLKTSELVPHGTRDAPWTMQIDEGWLRTFVQLRYYDPKKKKEAAVPQGIVLEALATNAVLGLASPRMGASSVRRDDGSIYVLHARDETKSSDLDYTFQTPASTTFELETGKFKSDALTDLARLEKEYPVAPLWHSLGAEAWEGATDASAGTRKSFATIRAKGKTAGSPISFHLDDLVLLAANGKPVALVPAAQRLGIYDANAGLRDPKQGSGKDLPYSKLTLKQFPLRAEEATFQRGQGAEKITRFVDHEGELYELSTSFLFGSPGTDSLIGARAATLAVPIQDNASVASMNDLVRGHRVYLFDTRWIRNTHLGKSGRLAHLLCYVSVFIDGTQLNAANADAVPIIESLLVESSKRWDQNHPGIDGSSGLAKKYAVVAGTGFKDESTVVRVRHVFGSRSTKGVQPIVVQVDTQPGRATGGSPMRLYCQSGPTIAPPPNPNWLLPDPKTAIPGAKLPARPYDFEPSGAALKDWFDDTSLIPFVFAHELGHEAGLVDEYLEGIKDSAIDPNAQGFLPRFNQWGYLARPYVFDSFGMMHFNALPRLRYIANYIEALHIWGSTQAADHWTVKERPFVAEYDAKKKTLRHALVRTAPNFTRTFGPWGARTGTQGLCNLALYPTSDDEGTIGPAFLSNGELAKKFDGILLIHPMFWFSFAASFTGSTLDRWNAMADWATRYSTVDGVPHFAIDTTGVTEFKRVAILFQPRFEFGPTPSTLSSGPESRNNATLDVNLRKGGGAPTFTAGGPPTLSMDRKDVGNWIFRYALQTQPAVVPRPNDNATTAADLSMLPQALATLIGRPEVGTVVPYGAL